MNLDFVLNCDILVVGTGIGGLVATKKLSPKEKKFALLQMVNFVVELVIFH